MRTRFRRMSSTALSATLLTMAGMVGITASSVATAADDKALAEGKKLAFDKKKGNCLACHLIAGGDRRKPKKTKR